MLLFVGDFSIFQIVLVMCEVIYFLQFGGMFDIFMLVVCGDELFCGGVYDDIG